MDKLQIYISKKYKMIFDKKKCSTLYFLSFFYFTTVLSDRFNLLNDEAEWNVLSNNDNIDEIKNTKLLSFEECCQKRVEELIDKANKENKKIYIACSGGVDSTCIVCSFLINDKLDKSNFFVLYNKFSIKEYPLFFDLLQKNNVNCIDIKEDLQVIEDIVKNDIIINGDCGDQLDGSIAIDYKEFFYRNNFSNWKDSLYKLVKNRYNEYDNFDKLFFDMENYSNYLQIPINTLFDFLWISAFGCKWSYVDLYMNVMSDNPNNVYSFFNTLFFQKYALSNYDIISSRNQLSPSTYKINWKKIIFKYTKDMNYFLYKGKDHTYYNKPNMRNFLFIKDINGYSKIKVKDNFEFNFIMKKYLNKNIL